MLAIERILTIVCLYACCGLSHAQSTAESLEKQSFLSVSAFQCAIVASDERQRERLFNLGLAAGRDFVDTAKRRPELYAKVRQKIPMLWNMSGGPTTDFMLGQIFAQLTSDIYKKFDSDKDTWRLIQDNMFRDKNCALIQ